MREHDSKFNPSNVSWAKSVFSSKEEIGEASKLNKIDTKADQPVIKNTSLEDLDSFIYKTQLLQTATSLTFTELQPKISSFIIEFAKYLEDLTTIDEQSAISKINYRFGLVLMDIQSDTLYKNLFDVDNFVFNRYTYLQLKENIETYKYSHTDTDYKTAIKGITHLHKLIDGLKEDPQSGKIVLAFIKLVENDWGIPIDHITEEWLEEFLVNEGISFNSNPDTSKVLDPSILEAYGEPEWKDLKWFISSLSKVWERHSRRVKKDMRLLEEEFKQRYNVYIQTKPEQEQLISRYLDARLGITIEDLGQNVIYTRLTRQARAQLTDLNPFKGQSRSTIVKVILILSPVPISMTLLGLTMSGLLDWTVGK